MTEENNHEDDTQFVFHSADGGEMDAEGVFVDIGNIE